MTLTEMIQAHDGSRLSDELAQAILDQIHKRAMPAGFWNNVELALTKDDMNAARRLLAPGWRWTSFETCMSVNDCEVWDVECCLPVPNDDTPLTAFGIHKSLPCAMVLAALKTHGVE